MHRHSLSDTGTQDQVVGDSPSRFEPKGPPAASEHAQESGTWLLENAWHPFVNGTGVLQVYDTLAGKPADPLPVREAKPFTLDWAAQSLCSAAGAIGPYVAMGKLAGVPLGVPLRVTLKEAMEKYALRAGVAQVLGAGAYDFLKAPVTGETRWGNAAGSMTGFGIFTGGNWLGHSLTKTIGSTLGRETLAATSRIGVGALGGLTSYDTANQIAGITGGINQAAGDGRWSAVATGGFLNFGLPLAHKGASTLAERAGQLRSSLASSLARPDARRPSGKPMIIEQPDFVRPGKLIPFDRVAFGSPDKLGATVTAEGINFAIHASGATRMELLLFGNPAAKAPSQTLPMYRTGDTHHLFVPGAETGTLYNFRADGPYTPGMNGQYGNRLKVLLDPYAKAIHGDCLPTGDAALGYDNTDKTNPNRHLKPSQIDNVSEMPKCVAVADTFDWQGDRKPNTPWTKSVVYEANVRGFTAGDATLGDLAGTFHGLLEKIPHLKKLGVTAVELMPIMQFDHGVKGTNPITGEPLHDAWGYSTLAFQAPDATLARSGSLGQQVSEFKTMVRELHANGIEVILDIVFNHTPEGDEHGRTISLRGLDNSTYYLPKPGHPDLYKDSTGCGNTVNTNHPTVQKFILDTLHYWVEDMHVDGFRFDLASIFKYDVDGQAKFKTPIIAAIENDPVLSKVKLIAEPWSIDQYDWGHFSDRSWSELNGPFRDTGKSFVKGDTGQLPMLAKLIAGSPDWFDQSKDRHPMNFVVNHDGFTMRDGVSYDTKHNKGNGEGNRDGTNDNRSWNCGWEGPVADAPIAEAEKAAIEALRNKQVKNLVSLTMLSRGTPYLLYGDEMGKTHNGNNNAYCQPKLNELDWNLVNKHPDTLRFMQMATELRASHDIGSRAVEDLTFHGTEPGKPDFSEGARFMAWEGANKNTGRRLYSAYNAWWEPLEVKLPEGEWRVRVDTNQPMGQDIVAADKTVPAGKTITVPPRTLIVLESLKR
jgi:isoamylase